MGLRARLHSAFARVDYLLTYALASFAQQVLERRLAAPDLLLAAAAAAVLAAAAQSAGGALGVTARSSHKVAAVLFAQHLLTGMPHPAAGGFARLARDTAAAVAAAVLLPTLLAPLLAEAAAEQVANLTFFMFAENSAQLVQDPELDRVLPAAAALVLWAAQARAPRAAAAEAAALRAVSMLATNVLVETLLGAGSGALHVVALAVTLVLFDSLAARLPPAAPLRDYAMWRGATLLLALLLARGAPLDGVVVGAALAGAAADAAGADAVAGLALLLAGNAALEVVHRALLGTPGRVAGAVLISVTNAVHLALDALQPAGG